MPRVRIVEQPRYRFRYATVLRVRDINYGGHLGNDSVAGLLHEARLEFLRQHGVTELDLGDGQTGIILSDLAIRFVAEGRMFDEVVIESEVGELSECSFRMFHRIRRGDTLLALAEAGIVAYVYAAHKVGPFPASLLDRIRPPSTSPG